MVFFTFQRAVGSPLMLVVVKPLGVDATRWLVYPVEIHGISRHLQAGNACFAKHEAHDQH